ncbi:MAG TPA: GNAT family N-acetyltransferase [Anaerolineae bacterium]|nr:GNAT family N-acetyltransferase [Anaerolineae bacterium]
MSEGYSIAYTDEPAWDVIGNGISRFNEEKAGSDRTTWLCFVLRAPDGEVLGGLIGGTFWQWLHVDLVWLPEQLRGQGYGRRLMELAEEEARRRGAKGAFLDTFDFQAPGFYERLGYTVFGMLPDCPTGHARYYMSKAL